MTLSRRSIIHTFASTPLWLTRSEAAVTPDIVQFRPNALMSLAITVLQFYWFAILVYVILSWVAPGTYSPSASLLASLCEPLLRPVRRLIPPLAGLDLSAVFVLIALQALQILIT